jgi:hypothetical protein
VRITRTDEGTITLSMVDPVCSHLLLEVTAAARTEHPAAGERFFSSPTQGREPEFEMDWVEFVQPDLQHLFQSALEVVDADLKGFPGTQPEEGATLSLAVARLESWIHALNQARLALVAVHGFSEEEMEDGFASEGSRRALVLFQVQFYGFLQECFLHELDGNSEVGG